MKSQIPLILIIVILLGCSSNKRVSTASINDRRVDVREIDIQHSTLPYAIDLFKVTPSIAPNSSGIIHHGFGITYSIDFVLQLKDEATASNQQIQISEIQMMKKNTTKVFEDSTGADTIFIIPKFKIINSSIGNTESKYKGSIQFLHIGSTRRNKLTIIFNNKQEEFSTWWHKS